MSHNTLKNRRGTAIAAALIIAAILLTGEAYLMKQLQNQIIQNEQHILYLQSWFAARAAMQHAMLKCRMMPTQLYDAAEFSVGKNPFFDFTEFTTAPPAIFPVIQAGSKILKRASPLNPGPRFLTSFTGEYPADPELKWTQIKKFHPDDLNQSPGISPWPEDAAGNPVANPSLYLHRFKSDVIFEAKTDPAMKESESNFPDGYPYDFSYSIENLEVMALQEQRKYNEEAVKITSSGMARYRNHTHTQKNQTVLRIKRKQAD